MTTAREIILTPSADGEGWLASVPSLPGLIAESDTAQQALADIFELIALREDGSDFGELSFEDDAPAEEFHRVVKEPSANVR